jgi:hypothetical protein
MTRQHCRTIRASWGGKGYGGFGFGAWRGIYGSQIIWSIALGPVTLYVARARAAKERLGECELQAHLDAFQDRHAGDFQSLAGGDSDG